MTPYSEALAAGLKPGDLDLAVLNCKAQEAREINKRGLVEQVMYLNAYLGEDGAKAEIACCAEALGRAPLHDRTVKV